MEVQLTPASVKQEEYGRLLGRVSAVSPFPVTSSTLQRVLGSEDLAKALTNGANSVASHIFARAGCS